MEKLREILKHKDGLEGELCRSEELGWLSTLLKLVDVTKPGADEHLKKFLNKGRSEVLKTHRAHLTKEVCPCEKNVSMYVCVHYMLYCRWLRLQGGPSLDFQSISFIHCSSNGRYGHIRFAHLRMFLSSMYVSENTPSLNSTFFY